MSRKTAVSLRYVDMWLMPNLHPTNIELLQKLKTADDCRFGTDMDVCGRVSEYDPKTGTWQKTHIAGIRSDLWTPDKKEFERSLKSLQKDRREELKSQIKRSGRLDDKQKQQLDSKMQEDWLMQTEADDLEMRRMVVKLFKTSSERMRWEGTIEELTATEIHNSMGSNRALLSMVVILQNCDYLSYLQQNRQTVRIPAVFTFCFYDHRQDRMWHVTIKRKWISIGADFTIEVGGKKIGDIDGKLIGLGYNGYVILGEHPLSNNGDFLDLLTLFTASVGYHRAMRRSIRKRIRAVKANQTRRHVLDVEEMRLRKNPRIRAA